MGIVSRIVGSSGNDKNGEIQYSVNDLADGALDTLGNVIRVMGSESFPLESDLDPAVFPQLCAEFARHVENGAAVPSFDITATADGQRAWARVRRFFADRRHAEKAFVSDRLQGYRGIVDDLVSGFRNIGQRDKATETDIMKSLACIEEALGSGALPEIQTALSETISQVNDTFARQKQEYEAQLQELNDRMSSMRQDLVAAREEMQRDALTEVFNRGGFDAAIVQSLNAHFILQQPVTLLMIDLDNFKQVNDSYGHGAGDAVLKAVGECLARAFIRKNDMIARYGGDEFAVILSDTAPRHATALIDRLLKMVRSIHIAELSGDIHVSCSVGYTEIATDDTVESLLKRADTALYQAKADGRNCGVFVAPDA